MYRSLTGILQAQGIMPSPAPVAEVTQGLLEPDALDDEQKAEILAIEVGFRLSYHFCS